MSLCGIAWTNYVKSNTLFLLPYVGVRNSTHVYLYWHLVLNGFCIVNVQKHDFNRSIFQQINLSSHENLKFEGSAQKSEIFCTTPAQSAISRTSDSYFSRILVMRSGNFSSGFCETDALKNFIYWEVLKLYFRKPGPSFIFP